MSNLISMIVIPTNSIFQVGPKVYPRVSSSNHSPKLGGSPFHSVHFLDRKKLLWNFVAATTTRATWQFHYKAKSTQKTKNQKINMNTFLDLLVHSGRKLTAPLNLKFSYTLANI